MDTRTEWSSEEESWKEERDALRYKVSSLMERIEHLKKSKGSLQEEIEKLTQYSVGLLARIRSIEGQCQEVPGKVGVSTNGKLTINTTSPSTKPEDMGKDRGSLTGYPVHNPGIMWSQAGEWIRETGPSGKWVQYYRAGEKPRD